MENQEIYQRLGNEMEDQYLRIRSEVRNYNPKKFHSMLKARGGYATAVALLTPIRPPDGFGTLLLCGRKDLTLEYLIFKDSQFRSLFTEQIIQNIERRLKGLI